MNNKLTYDEKAVADMLRQEILKVSETQVAKPASVAPNISDIEMVSEVEEKPYVSPIFTMNEDEILAFVEEFDVGELATLSDEELAKIGEKLGMEPAFLGADNDYEDMDEDI